MYKRQILRPFYRYSSSLALLERPFGLCKFGFPPAATASSGLSPPPSPATHWRPIARAAACITSRVARGCRSTPACQLLRLHWLRDGVQRFQTPVSARFPRAGVEARAWVRRRRWGTGCGGGGWKTVMAMAKAACEAADRVAPTMGPWWRGGNGGRTSEKRSKDGLAEQGQVERERSKE